MMTPETLLQLLDDPATVIAVVGATDDPGKFGYKIYRDLKRKGYKVYPVNPNRARVDGDRAYPEIVDLPERPHLVNLVVPPEAVMAVLHECLALGLTRIWLQPGAESPEVLAFLDAHGFAYLAQACIMVESRGQR
jgi:predicted CoA-binding protein